MGDARDHSMRFLREGAESKKFEARKVPRGLKEIQMTKKHNVPNNPDSDSKFWIFQVWDLFRHRFVWNFGFRILIRG